MIACLLYNYYNYKRSAALTTIILPFQTVRVRSFHSATQRQSDATLCKVTIVMK